MRGPAWISALSLALSAPSRAPCSGEPRAPEPEAAMPRAGLGARPERAREAAAANADCQSCHAEIADEWRASFHARAATDPAFQTALAVEPTPFCRGCHAAEAPPEREAPKELADLGVACTTCHAPEQEILAAPKASSSRAPHRSLRTAAFASSAGCAGCHEFDFPDAARRAHPEKMQLTVSEHRASPFADTSCASCHMPLVGEGDARHRSHAFPSHAPGAQARALDIHATRRADTVTVVLAPREVGHAFPTGDLFRRLEVSAEILGADGARLMSTSRYLGRHFQSETLGGARARVTRADDRPGANGAREVTAVLALGARACGEVAVVRVAYQRVTSSIDGQESKALVGDEVLLFQSSLKPDPSEVCP